MLRINYYNVFYDLRLFIKNHAVKFIILLILHGIVFALGIKSALDILDISEFIPVRSYSVVIFVEGSRSFFGFMLMRFMTLLTILFIMLLLSYRVWLSFINFILLTILCYINAFMITAMILYMGVQSIPLLVFCIAPLFLVYYLVLLYFSVLMLSKSFDFQCYGDFFSCIKDMSLIFLVCVGIFLIFTILETLLLSILSIGVVF